ncbi:MAG: DUF4846 domain-containing protein [Candidatus Edwardsbacteria bacterium]|nr:DUF4846 domain-containing protein [Candidatus Edwardsbacteria bacterium]
MTGSFSRWCGKISSGRIVRGLLAPLVAFSASLLTAPLSGQVRDVSSIPAPPGFARLGYPAGSFCAWVARLPLQQSDSIKTFDGRDVSENYDVLGVIDLPLLFRADLEQCADWCLRLWAKYHKDSGKLDKLYLFDYNGRKKYFRNSGKTLARFLKWSMDNANSYSLLKGCAAVDSGNIRPGDMFVQNRRGGIGHVSMALDACRDSAGRELYLVGYSYMPAQEFHIERAGAEYGIGGWFSYQGYCRFLHDRIDLGTPVLRRFDE